MSSFSYSPCVKRTFNAVIKQNGKWWIGWVEEIPGVNSQGKTRKELLANLRSALTEALEFNREEALAAAADHYTEEPITV
jgi:predicted RNase H-like HicB family nuclease